VGSYLSIGTTAAIFCGGLVKSLAERGMKRSEEGEASPGALYASGLIAAGGIVGLLAIVVKLIEGAKTKVTWLGWVPTDWARVGRALHLDQSNVLAMIVFTTLAFSLYFYARKPLEEAPRPPKDEARTEA
jgi:formate hydrogenlyase subunit 3/multisubunit Na+/H+ antiporter MnhD subunit